MDRFICDSLHTFFSALRLVLRTSGSLPSFCKLVFEISWETCGNGLGILGKGQIGLSSYGLETLFCCSLQVNFVSGIKFGLLKKLDVPYFL